MKKIIFILAIAGLALASCTQFKEETTSKDFKKPIAPFVVVTEQTETSISFQVNAADNSFWYAYTVLAGSKESVSGSKILSVKTGGLAEACKEFSKEKSADVKIEGLSRGTTYTIYTVSTSSNGVESEVRATEFTTEDTQIPSIAADATEENVYQILFSEAVSVAEGLAPTAKYYAENKGELGDAEVEVEVEGKIATFVITTKLFAGTYYTISYPEGLFVDDHGNKIKAMESSFTGVKNGEPQGKGLIGHISNENFDLEIYGGEDVEVVTSMSNPIWIAVPEDFIYYKYDNTLPGTIEYDYTSAAGAHSVITYPFSGFPNYGWNSTYNCALSYPNYAAYTGRPDPEAGSWITITIPEGFLIDIYGNVSNEFVIGPFLFAFDFEVSDICGKYVQNGESMFGASYDEEDFELTIEESDKEEAGNIMITSFYGCDDIAIYGTFEPTTGSVEFALGQEYIGEYADEEKGILYVYYIDGCDGKSFVHDISFKFNQVGVLASEDIAWGVIYDRYAIPEGGVEAVTDDDYIDYDYNFFYIDAKLSNSGVKSVKYAPRKLSDIQNRKVLNHSFNKVK